MRAVVKRDLAADWGLEEVDLCAANAVVPLVDSAAGRDSADGVVHVAWEAQDRQHRQSCRCVDTD
jgi:hypothetical protein